MADGNAYANRIATEQETLDNIAWAKAKAASATSPDGLTTLAKSFWHALHSPYSNK